jgi:hypothetical protein
LEHPVRGFVPAFTRFFPTIIAPYQTRYAGSSLAMNYPDWLMMRLDRFIWGSTGDLPLPQIATEFLDISRFRNAQIEQPKRFICHRN